MNNVLSVLQLNTYIKRKFEQDFVLKNVSVEGELSNFKRHSSGHIYFTLKDDKAQVSCVLFKTYLSGIEDELRDGAKVIIKGSVSLYEKSGQYQIYVRKIEKAGIGELFVLFEKLKKKLQKEGLFDERSKRNIPKYAHKIGIITSSTGAAIRDIVQVAKRRNPYVELILYPSLVQGDFAKDNIVKGIEYFNYEESVDIIIVGRGGGSIEDLWPFNEEVVARAIFESNTPIISGVGHETDFVISDFVSDLRAPTPSAAAELAVFDYYEFNNKINQYKIVLKNRFESYIQLNRQKLLGLTKLIEQKHPRQSLEDKMLNLEQLRLLLISRGKRTFENKRNLLSILNERLKGKSPLARIDEGYAYITYKGNRVTSINDIKENDQMEVLIKDGKLITTINSKEVI